MPRVYYFELFATDPGRAMQFYGNAFGWAFAQWENEPYWLIRTGPDDEEGINGGLVHRPPPQPQPGQPVNAYVCTIRVDSLEAAAQAIQQNGGRITVQKQALPGVGWRAYGIDTEGNVIAIIQIDPTAA